MMLLIVSCNLFETPERPICKQNSCSGHGACFEKPGSQILCKCFKGYLGDACETCDSNNGYHLSKDSQICTNNPCNPNPCQEKNTTLCTPKNKTEVICSCSVGYKNYGDGLCKPEHPCLLDNPCQEANLICLNNNGKAECNDCISGYQDNNNDSICFPSCETSLLICSNHSYCDDTNGEAQCKCEENYLMNDNNECILNIPSGFNCNDPIPLDFNADVIIADTSESENNHYGSCQPDSDKEIIYYFEIMDQVNLKILVSGFDTIMYLRKTCNDYNSQVICDDDSGGRLASYIDTILDPGQYYLFIDGYEGESNTFELQSTITCTNNMLFDTASYSCVVNPCDSNPCEEENKKLCTPVLPNGFECNCNPGYMLDENNENCILNTEKRGESCDDAILLNNEVTSISNSTENLYSFNTGTCAGEGNEQIYKFEIDKTSMANFIMNGYDTVLYLRSECSNNDSELICNDDSYEKSASISIYLAPGIYYLFADSFDNNNGSYELVYNINSDPCLENPCGENQECKASENWDNYECICPDGTIDYNTTCIDNPCLPNPCTEIEKNKCTAEHPDSFTCSCSIGYIQQNEICIPNPNAEGEDCSDAVILTEENNTIIGSTLNANNDRVGFCGGRGADRVYNFSLIEEKKAEFTVDGFDTVMYLRQDCKNPSTEIVCNDDYNSAGSGSGLSIVLDPGYYSIIIDSYNRSGNYEFTYKFVSNPCNNYQCPNNKTCIPDAEWQNTECICPENTLAFEEICVDNPCEPNPCIDEKKNLCISLLPDNYSCKCNPGYIENTDGICVIDPDANDWLIMTFLNADNDLEADGLTDIIEMEMVGSTSNVHIVTLLDTDTNNQGDARKIYIKQNESEVIENMGEIDMGNWETLADFGVWAVQNYKARHYALIIWDHGDGWSKKFKPSSRTKSFSQDYHGSQEGISVAKGEYENALKKITNAISGKIDIIGFDACLMGMWEVAEVSSYYGDYLVASEENMPNTGYVYNEFLKTVVDNPEMSPADLAKAIVDSYYLEDEQNVTLSVTDLNTMNDLSVAISSFANTLISYPQFYMGIEQARINTQTFSERDFKDLKDFAQKVKNMNGLPEDLINSANTLIDQLDLTIIHNKAKDSYSNAFGLSIYLPEKGDGMKASYRDIGALWSHNTTWDEFLMDFTDN